MRSAAPRKTTPRTDGLDRLTVGAHVFYPALGVASVVGMEKRQFGQGEQEFYVLELERTVRLLLPTAKLVAAGLRALISPTKARELMRSVAAEPTADSTPWRERTASYADELRDGAPERYTDILRRLLFRARSEKLTTIDRRLLETARNYFVGEIGVVLQRTPQQINTELQELTHSSALQREAE
jgi:CarD family transcriptional regulator